MGQTVEKLKKKTKKNSYCSSFKFLQSFDRVTIYLPLQNSVTFSLIFLRHLTVFLTLCYGTKRSFYSLVQQYWLCNFKIGDYFTGKNLRLGPLKACSGAKDTNSVHKIILSVSSLHSILLFF